MAKKSIPAAQDTIPGFIDLVQFEDFEDPKRIADAVENVRLPLVLGIGAIGQLLVDASESKVGNAAESLSEIGWLLSALSRQIDHLNDVHDNAMYEVHEAESAKAGAK